MPYREADNSTNASSGDSDMPQPDTAAAIKFLQRWRSVGVLTLVAILPDGKPSDVEGRSWITERPGVWPQISRWIDRWQGKRNLYFTANEARLMDKKPAKTDMTRIWAYFTDADPDTSQGYAVGRAHLMGEMLLRFTDGDLPASVVIDSGNGLQALWLRVDGEPIAKGAIEAFEAINKPFSELMGSQGTYNVDRLLRIPGTINLPNKAKLKKGYPAEPSLAQVVHYSDVRYTTEQLMAWTEKAQAEATARARAEAEAKRQQQQDHQLAGLPEALRTRFAAHLKSDAMLARRWRGDTTGLKDDTRSGVDMSLGAQLKKRGYSFNEMTAILRIFRCRAGRSVLPADLGARRTAGKRGQRCQHRRRRCRHPRLQPEIRRGERSREDRRLSSQMGRATAAGRHRTHRLRGFPPHVHEPADPGWPFEGGQPALPGRCHGLARA
jgi:hypothetical protein